MNFRNLNSGTSVAGMEIPAFKSHTAEKHDHYIYLMAGVHGDEVEGVYVLDKLFAWLKNETELELPFIIVPIVNIDGYQAGTRTNASGIDLNRNFPSQSWSPDFNEDKYNPGPSALSEVENQFLEQLFQKFTPKLIISFHSWKPFINYNGEGKKIAEFLGNLNKYDVVEDIGYPTPGSLGDYAPEKYQCPVITFECPVLNDSLSLKDIWLQNESAIKELINSNLL